MKLIQLKYDFCVKEVMDNETVRKYFLSDVLNIKLEEIKSARIINPFLWKRYRNQKLGILDIQLELNNDTKINIEVQLKQKADWEKRTVFYLAKMFTADLRRNENYEKAKKCIAITILDFDVDSRNEYHHIYMLRDISGKVYTDVLELHTIELKKRPDSENPRPLDEWHSLFNAKTEEELEMIKSKTNNVGIIEAIKELKHISFPKMIRMEYEMRLKAKRDRYAEDKFVFEQGREQGREDGMHSLVKSLRRNGCADEQIAAELMQEYGLDQDTAMAKVKSPSAN